MLRFRRSGLRKFDIFVAVVLGVITGNYIWKPVFEKQIHKKEIKEPELPVNDLSSELDSSEA